MNCKPIHALSAFFAGVSTLVPAAPALAESPAASGPVVQAAAIAAIAPGADVAQARADLGRGFDLLGAGRQEQAVALFDRVIAALDHRAPGDGRARVCRSGRDGAGSSGQSPVLVDGAVCDAYFGKGFALIDLGRGDLAEADLRRATEMAPDNAHFANEYAELYKSRRDWPEAYRLFARAWAVVDKAPRGPDAAVAARALRGMGFSEIGLGNYDRAEELFRQSLAFDPGSIAAKAELGHIARRKAIGS